MTREQQERLHDAVENLWFKGAARLAMLLATVVGGPLTFAVMMRTYDAIDRLDRAQAKLEAVIERIELTATNDRGNEARVIDNVNDRITILSNRITDVQHDYARLGDVKAGFELRDQHLNAIDNRLDRLEGRKER